MSRPTPPVLALAGVFAISRVVAAFHGLAFDPSPLHGFWQFLDPELLAHDLGRSLWYLHAQPPLFNAATGILLKTFPDTYALVAHVLFVGLGWFLCLGSYRLLRRLGLGAWMAGIPSLLLCLRPETLLYENRLMYDLPVAALLVAAALLLDRGLGGSPWARHGFFGTLAALALTRGFFHLAFLLAVLALLLLSTAERKHWSVAAALPLLVVAGLYAKNALLFGHFGPSSWVGSNLARISMAALPEEDRKRLVATGELSPASSVEPFSTVGAYPERYRRAVRHPEIPAVAETRKSTGAPNYNHEAYVAIGRDLTRDARWIVLHRPLTYLAGFARAVYNYTRPGSDELHLRPRAPVPGSTAARFESLLYLRLPAAIPYQSETRDLYLTPLLGLPLALAFGLWTAFRSGEDPRLRVLVGFLALTLVYVTAVGTLFEVWENARFRYSVDVFWVGLAVAAVDRWIRSRGGAGSTPDPTPENRP